jgi:peptidoglycan/xylan/chitin deacetylase (PgdA/CDA1 family)
VPDGGHVRSDREHAALRRALGVLAVAAALSLGGCGSGDSATRGGAPGAQATPPSGVRAALLRDDAAIDEVLGYAPFIALGGAGHKEIALTFDDGPGPTTPALLDYLKADAVPATFFLVGRAVAQHTDVVRREVARGFTIGSHSESHGRLASRTIGDQEQEILTTADRITRISRHAVRLFRPPYGSYDARTLEILHAERMLMVMWSIDPRDYVALRPRQIVDATLKAAKPGAIVLLHDGPGARPKTLAAVRMLVPALRRRGYRLVSLPELLRDDPPPRHQPAPRSDGA